MIVKLLGLTWLNVIFRVDLFVVEMSTFRSTLAGLFSLTKRQIGFKIQQVRCSNPLLSTQIEISVEY